ncbi:MAG TPA: DUF6065 family protein [Gemmataceae bacterium]|nr:DUF6065 family protein [Gemmataceae bacterium]
MPDDARLIQAYEIHDPRDMPIVCAPARRDWRDAIGQHFPYRCLPLVMANQAGWLLLNPVGFSATWNGGPALDDLDLLFGDTVPADPLGFQVCDGDLRPQPPDSRIKSHFGSGIVTFSLPYLFRTPPGVNLWVGGPSNCVKDGACPLEGLVETDWSPATFTMNCKLTRPGLKVRFARGEPICMLVPLPRGLAESLEARQLPLRSDPDLAAAYDAWRAQRGEFLRALEERVPEAVERGWQKDYFQGRGPGDIRFEGRQTQLRLKEFTKEPS